MNSLHKHVPIGLTATQRKRLFLEYETLPESHKHALHEYLQGGGVLSDAFTWLKGKLLNTIPPELKRFLDKHGNEPIQTLHIVRIPLNKAVQFAVDLLTSGNFSKNKRSLNYQEVYHLFLVVNNRYRIERNETIQAFFWDDLDQIQPKDVFDVSQNLPSRPLTIREMIITAAQNEPNFWRYSTTNNCQAFVMSCLKWNNLLDGQVKSIQNFVLQDPLGLVKGSSTNQQTVIQTITDIASIGRNYILPSLKNYINREISGGNVSQSYLEEAGRILYT